MGDELDRDRHAGIRVRVEIATAPRIASVLLPHGPRVAGARAVGIEPTHLAVSDFESTASMLTD